MTSKSDLVVLGAGNVGQGAAGIARQAGQSVVVIESRDVGGTCPLRGCVPKKVLVAAAETLQQINLAHNHHIHTAPASVDWEKLMARKQSFVDGVPQAFEKGLVERGIEVVHGQARFVDGHTVVVNGQHYAGKKILIATGSKSRTLPIAGFEHTITSDDILELKKLPRSLVFIGGGVIAFEFAHVLARAGVKVTILEILPRPLPLRDRDPVKKLLHETRRLGVEILTEVKTKAIEKQGNGYEVAFDYYDTTHTITADMVANGAGRIADIDKLALDVAGVKRDQRGIIVDDYLRSVSNPDVFAAGDALATAQLSALATYEGKVVVHNLTHEEMISPDYNSIPNAVYTVPALASVGLTEAAASEKDLKFEARINDMREWRSARTYAETAAYAKVLVEEGSDKILGAHILGHGATEIIHIFALAMKHRITAKELAETVYAYPTFASDIRFMV